MRIGDLSPDEFGKQLAGEGATIKWGPFRSLLRCTLSELAKPLHLLYRDFPLQNGGVRDFHVDLGKTGGPLAKFRSKAEFRLDNVRPFPPFERKIALAMLEWGMNWCVYSSAHQYLVLHAAVIARGQDALLLSGRPGAGKSTLCAALVASGWRLLSDELALVRPDDGKIMPISRPISLKGPSIDLISSFYDAAVFGPVIADTVKGTVSHLRPPTDSVTRVGEPAFARWIIFPQYLPDALADADEISKARAYFTLADNSFNYEILGEAGFDTLCRLIDGCSCHRLTYSALNDGIAEVELITAQQSP